MPNLLTALSRLSRPFAGQAEVSPKARTDKVADRLAQMQAQQAGSVLRTGLFRG